MKQWFALSAIGHNRPGIVADLSELIYECDCNLEDSSMTVLGSEFAVLLVLSGQGEEIGDTLSKACKRLEWEKRLTVFFRPLDHDPASTPHIPEIKRFKMKATGGDKAGIVARVSRCLADHGISITQMGTQSRPEPESGAPIYTMHIEMEVPVDTDEAELRDALDTIGRDLYIDLSLTAC